MTYEYPKDYALYDKVQKLIPNGIQMPRTPIFSSFGDVPVFVARAQGSKFWDIDGNEFIDYMCSYGAVGLGYNHPKVEEAARAQLTKVSSCSLPSERWVELAELIVAEIPMADWVVYGKNGSDATTYAAMLARHVTGKPGIARMRGAYHGFHHWCIASDVGQPPEYKMHVYDFNFNDVEDLEDCVAKHKDHLAGIFLTPVGHWAMRDQEQPIPGWFEKVREICDREGLLMIIDDVRCGFRFDFRGTHRYYANVEPDVICYAKTIANGWPISVAACAGKHFEAAKKIYWSATQFYSAAPMAAAIACIKTIKEEGLIDKMKRDGERFMKTLAEQATSHGIKVRVTGHPSMPYMMFDDDPQLGKNRFFCGQAARRGIFLHPHHNWFISAALTEEDLKKTFEVTDQAFKLTKEKFGL
jgi:glutamate-1-semialdehyde 2,1-aminomutase